MLLLKWVRSQLDNGQVYAGEPKGEFVSDLRLTDLTLDPCTQSSPLFITLHHHLPVNRLPHSTFNVMAGKTQLERAIKEIQGRRPAPDIDFTQHQLENGFTVSTQERVVKEVRLF